MDELSQLAGGDAPDLAPNGASPPAAQVGATSPAKGGRKPPQLTQEQILERNRKAATSRALLAAKQHAGDPAALERELAKIGFAPSGKAGAPPVPLEDKPAPPPAPPLPPAVARKLARTIWSGADKVAVKYAGPGAKLTPDEMATLEEAWGKFLEDALPEFLRSPLGIAAITTVAVYGPKVFPDDWRALMAEAAAEEKASAAAPTSEAR